MGDEATTEPAATQPNPGMKRQRTQIAFPYTDLQRSKDLTTKVVELGGAGPVELTQLAAAMNQTADGGTFRGRLSAARMFGLIEYNSDTAHITELGKAMLDVNQEAAAKAEAFLKVPLYAKLYDQYQGYPLPQAAAIQRQMIMYGLPSKQVERARQAFASSIDTAGFINSSGRFIKPITNQKPASEVAGGGRSEPGPTDRFRKPAGPFFGGGGTGNEPPGDVSKLLLDLLDPATMTPEETQAVWTLLLYIKKPKAQKPAADEAKDDLEESAADR